MNICGSVAKSANYSCLEIGTDNRDDHNYFRLYMVLRTATPCLPLCLFLFLVADISLSVCLSVLFIYLYIILVFFFALISIYHFQF